jgi:hypothetical protein
MSVLVGIVGSAGSGKSTSFFPEPTLGIIGLDPKVTFVINVSGKPFPFKGWRNIFIPFNGETGNYINTENAGTICKAMVYVNDNRPEITNIIVDDFQYLMGFEFVEKAMTKGYDKFSEIAMHTMQVLNTGRRLRDNIKTFVLAHSEEVDLNFETTKKIKTIGRFLDEKIELPGLFTVLLYTKTTWHDQEKKMTYEFVTNRDVSYPAKSPYGMFKTLYIPNDLGLVAHCIDEYENNGSKKSSK